MASGWLVLYYWVFGDDLSWLDPYLFPIILIVSFSLGAAIAVLTDD